MEFDSRDHLIKSAYNLLLQVPLAKWRPLEWQVDRDTLRWIQRLDYQFHFMSEGDKWMWVEGLPLKVVRIEESFPTFDADITLAMQKIVSEPSIFSLCCKGKRTGRLYWIDDERSDKTLFSERPDTLTVQVT